MEARKNKLRAHVQRASRRGSRLHQKARVPGQNELASFPEASGREDTPYFRALRGSIPPVRHRAPKAKFRALFGCAKARSPAPFPSLRPREWRSSSLRFFLLAKGKARSGTLDDALQVAVMIVTDQQSEGQTSDADDE